MYIESIKWLDEAIREAEVTVSDGHMSIVCFSHPLSKKINVNLTEPVYCLNPENIVTSIGQAGFAKKYDNAFGYLICGKLIDKHNRIVLLGNIMLCLEDAYLPTDILENSFIEFSVSRLTIY
jgi:hypothetical protein